MMAHSLRVRRIASCGGGVRSSDAGGRRKTGVSPLPQLAPGGHDPPKTRAQARRPGAGPREARAATPAAAAPSPAPLGTPLSPPPPAARLQVVEAAAVVLDRTPCEVDARGRHAVLGVGGSNAVQTRMRVGIVAVAQSSVQTDWRAADVSTLLFPGSANAIPNPGAKQVCAVIAAPAATAPACPPTGRPPRSQRQTHASVNKHSKAAVSRCASSISSPHLQHLHQLVHRLAGRPDGAHNLRRTQGRGVRAASVACGARRTLRAPPWRAARG